MQLPREVETYLGSIVDERQREDSRILVETIARITGEQPKMWGSIIGFGELHYKYASGHEGDTMTIGLAARKQALTLYGLIYYETNREYLERLGKHSMGKGCLYIKRLSDIDMAVLEEMIARAWNNPVLTQEAA